MIHKNTYSLSSVKGNRSYVGTFAEAIDAAKRMDEELRPAFGVEIDDEEGNNLAHVEDGKVELAEP